MEKENHHEFRGEFEALYRETPKFEEPEFLEHDGGTSLTAKQRVAIGAMLVVGAGILAGILSKVSKEQPDQKTTAPAAPSAVTPQ